MSNWQSISLTDLRLDQLNYRTGPQTTQRTAIRAIIDDQKQLLINLASDLLEVGPSPGEPIWVVPKLDEKGAFTVLEGNRRTAALKLLETPALADGTIVEDDFNTLAKQFQKKPIEELEAQVFATREDALPWIRRRHMTSVSGVGMQPWKTMAKGRANREHGQGTPRSLAVFELLEDESNEWVEIVQALDNKWTTVDRVLDTKPLREKLGVTIDVKSGAITFGNGNHEAGKKLLQAILGTMASANFQFSQVETLGDREKFLDKFAAKSVKAVASAKSKAPSSTKGQASAATPAPAATSNPSPAKANLNTNARPTLAPKSGTRTFQVNGVRLNSIYRECRSLAVAGNENAAALLLRVFIELSSEALLAEKAVGLPSNQGKRGKTNWDDMGIPLAVKIACVADYLDPTKKAKAFQQARVLIDPSTQSPSSITTLHGYFHNRDMKPDSVLVQEAWDAWEIYLKSLHEAR